MFVIFFSILLLTIDIFFHLDGYVAIVDKLERLLNLKILTKGTKVYTVGEECLSIARSYISQPTVGHRLRHRWRTNDHCLFLPKMSQFLIKLRMYAFCNTEAS